MSLHLLEARIEKAAVFMPFRKPSRYKGAWGGRGSGKSHEFAGNVVLHHAMNPGARTLCVREVQKTLKESAKRLIEDKIDAYGLRHQGFEPKTDRIDTPGGGTISFIGMQDYNADSIKSFEGASRLWFEEAATCSKRSLELLRPTIRAPGSELWFSWNPQNAEDPVDQMLRGERGPSDAIVLRANWSDNPWFPKELEQERQDCLRNDPERYAHIWEGEYARIIEGAYFADVLDRAYRDGRVTSVGWDHLYRIRAYWDIGGTSGKSDATAIWIAQFAGEQIRVLDYYEAVGQSFADHVEWLRRSGWEDAVQILPHDGAKHDTVHRVTPASYLRGAGFKVETRGNAGTGAAMKRIEAVRRVFHRCWFDEEHCVGGLKALAWYHERQDERRRIGLGPEHDWSSHGADAFGALAIDALMQDETAATSTPVRILPGVA